eukprot:1795447-Rhodomonas_salina.1
MCKTVLVPAVVNPNISFYSRTKFPAKNLHRQVRLSYAAPNFVRVPVVNFCGTAVELISPPGPPSALLNQQPAMQVSKPFAVESPPLCRIIGPFASVDYSNFISV